MERKIGKLVLIASLLCFSCQEKGSIIKGKIPYDDQYHNICELGDFNIHDDDPTRSYYGINFLPPGYYGSYPDTGILEIGGRAGDENGRECPIMDFNVTKRNATLLFSIQFESNPLYFSMNHIRKQLGYEICYLDPEGNEQYINHYTQGDSLGEVYSRQGINGYHYDDSYSRIVSFIYEPKNALCISMNFMKKEKLKYMRFIYGDIPYTYRNVSITLSRSNIDDDIEANYSLENDCSRNDYIKKLGSDVEYELTSQYGYCYSKNYLLSLFIVKDENDNTQDHLTTIIDDDNYFTTGRYAPLGSRYDLLFRHTNSLGNTSTLTLHLTVKDKSAPLIQKKNEQEIKVSYKTDFNSDFINRYFNVTDNHDEEVIMEIQDSFGNPLTNEIGKKTVVLKAIDSSDNISKFPFVLERFDDIPPSITTKYDEINISKNQVMTSTDLLSLFSVYDEIDGKMTPTIEENTYSTNCHEVGEYFFTVSATDKAGNRNTKTIKIYVNEESKPIFYTKESFLTFVEGNIPSSEDIINSLIRNKVIKDRNYISMEYIAGDEISSSLKEGSYESTIECIADDGESEIIDLYIEVIRKEETKLQKTENNEESAQEKEESWWDKFCRWWKELFESILDIICFWK